MYYGPKSIAKEKLPTKTRTLGYSVHDQRMHFVKLVLDILLLVLLLLEFFSIQFHLNVLELSGNHVIGDIG